MEREKDHVDRVMAQWREQRPDIDPSPQGVVGRIHRLGDYLDSALTENFARFGLTRGEFDVLAALRRAGTGASLNAGELAASTMITSGGLTKRVDRLEQRGLVKRIVSATDTRSRDISLTDDGLALVDEVFDAHMRLEHALVAQLDGSAEPLARILRSWLVQFESAADKP